MPLPLVFIIPAAAAGIAGAGKTTKGLMDNHEANRLTGGANSRIEAARCSLERSRGLCADSLSHLGEEKLFVLNDSITRFIDSFERIKNLDLVDSLGLEELRKFHVDRESIGELREMSQFAIAVAGGAGAGATGGALTAIGAYSAAMSLASASTGTAISALGGAAATNATLAFFGGGSLAVGGLGMAGGIVVLGGIVAGPALLAMGLITGKKADEKLDIARSNDAQANEICEQLDDAAFQCDAIRRRTCMFYTFLARLDARFFPLVFHLEGILATEGVDYSQYSPESKRAVLLTATMAASIKSILDTPILTEDGALTDESLRLTESLGINLENMQ